MLLKKSKESQRVIQLALDIQGKYENKLRSYVLKNKLTPYIVKNLSLRKLNPGMSKKQLQRSVQMALFGHNFIHLNVPETPVYALLSKDEIQRYKAMMRLKSSRHASKIAKQKNKGIFGLNSQKRTAIGKKSIENQGLKPFQEGEILLIKLCVQSKEYLYKRKDKYYFNVTQITKVVNQKFYSLTDYKRKNGAIANKIVKLGFRTNNISRIEDQKIVYF